MAQPVGFGSEHTALLGSGGINNADLIDDDEGGYLLSGKRRTASLFWKKVVLFTLAASAAMICYIIRVLPSVALEGQHGIAHEFNWTNTNKGTLDSALFYGYISTQIPGGWLASRFGGKYVMLGVVMLTCISTAVLPLIAMVPEHSVVLACVLRCITGIAQGPLYPTWGVLAATWLSVDERGFWAGAFSAGSAAGIVVAWVAGPQLMNAAAGQFGWKVCFYGSAALGVPWAIVWLLFTSSNPPPTSASERALADVADALKSSSSRNQKGGMIDQAERGVDGGAPPPMTATPWRALLTSPGMNASYVTNFGCGWIFYMLLTFLPQYLEQRFAFDLRTSGVYAELPYIGRALVLFGGGFAADMMLRKKVASLLTVRRLFNTLASIGPAVFLMAVTFTSHEESTPDVKSLVLTLIILGVAVSGCQMQGCVLVPVDLFPEASGVAYGLGNLFGNVPGIVAPALTGHMLDVAGCPSGDTSNTTITKECLEGWNHCIYLAAAVGAAGGVVFLFGAGFDKRYQKQE